MGSQTIFTRLYANCGGKPQSQRLYANSVGKPDPRTCRPAELIHSMKVTGLPSLPTAVLPGLDARALVPVEMGRLTQLTGIP